jgi:hypothetical protein
VRAAAFRRTPKEARAAALRARIARQKAQRKLYSVTAK